MDSERDDNPKLDRILEEVRDGAERARRSSLWDRAATATTAFLLAVSLTLGIQGEIRSSPISSLPRPAIAEQSVRMQRTVSEQLESDVARLDHWLQTPEDREAFGKIVNDLSEDLKTVIQLPCSEEIEKEAVDLLLSLQLELARKVANGTAIDPHDQRLKKFLAFVKNLCA